MMTLYGLTEQEWLNLAAFCTISELKQLSILDLKGKHYSSKVCSSDSSRVINIKAQYMIVKLHNEIASISSSL